MREQITSGGGVSRHHHHLPLFAIEIRSKSSQVEFREKRTLKNSVDAMNSAKLRFLYLVIQHSSIACSFHHHWKSNSIELNKIEYELNPNLFVFYFIYFLLFGLCYFFCCRRRERKKIWKLKEVLING